ncbi:MAG: LytTR family transcriptional regulator DNA-binding domain-containing protein [Muribaculaceae bacterium]
MTATILKERFQSALIAILLIAIFLPFGLSHFGWMRWVLLAGLGIIVVFAVLASELIVENVFRMPNDVSRGSRFIIRRNILFEMLNIAISAILMTFYLDAYANNHIVQNRIGWTTICSVLAINCYTTLIIHFYWRNVYKKRYLASQLEEAQMLNGMLQERQRQLEANIATPSRGINEKRILITGTTKESIEFKASDFIYATSEGNYVRFHYLHEDIPCEAMIRNSMKNVSDTLCRQHAIMQCHRAFIVNLGLVDHVEGRSSGMALVMQHTDQTVPVSKQYAPTIKERIKNPG